MKAPFLFLSESLFVEDDDNPFEAGKEDKGAVVAVVVAGGGKRNCPTGPFCGCRMVRGKVEEVVDAALSLPSLSRDGNVKVALSFCSPLPFFVGESVSACFLDCLFLWPWGIPIMTVVA